MSYPCTFKDGLKWCLGPCGRPLPEEAFYRGGRGYVNSHCKDCERVESRARYHRNAKKPRFLCAQRNRKWLAYHAI